jgi:tetratricopeptide (TPR) repeat protein
LAAADKANTEATRDLSAALDDLGDAQLKSSDAAAALASYQESLAIRRRLAATDQTNMEWQRDLTVSLIKVGDVQLAQGDAAAALASYEEALTLRRRLAATDPNNAQFQTDLVLALYKVARVAIGDQKNSSIDEALRLLTQLGDEGKLSPSQQTWKDQITALRQGPQ